MKDGKDVGVIYEYLSYWHPGQRRVVLNQWSSDGTYGTGTMTASSDRTTESRQSFFEPGGGEFHVLHLAEKLEGEARLQSFRLSNDGIWEQGRRYVWKPVRQQSARHFSGRDMHEFAHSLEHRDPHQRGRAEHHDFERPQIVRV